MEAYAATIDFAKVPVMRRTVKLLSQGLHKCRETLLWVQKDPERYVVEAAFSRSCSVPPEVVQMSSVTGQMMTPVLRSRSQLAGSRCTRLLSDFG